MNIDEEFRAYKAAALPRVITPGAEEVWRTVHRRQRRRLQVAGVFTVVAAGASAAQLLPMRPATTDMTPTWSESPATTAAAAPSASPSSTAQNVASQPPSPPPTTAQPARTTSPAAAPRVDLTATGPGQAVLTPANGRYEGTMTARFTNEGTGTYAYGMVRVTLPDGATFDFQGIPESQWGMDACGQQAAGVWDCVARPAVIPFRGGNATVRFHIIVPMAPQPQPITLEGARIQPIAYLSPGNQAPDATPGNNVHGFSLQLNPS